MITFPTITSFLKRLILVNPLNLLASIQLDQSTYAHNCRFDLTRFARLSCWRTGFSFSFAWALSRETSSPLIHRITRKVPPGAELPDENQSCKTFILTLVMSPFEAVSSISTPNRYLEYVEINPEASTTLLMVHGWPSLWSSWSNQIEEFQVRSLLRTSE